VTDYLKQYVERYLPAKAQKTIISELEAITKFKEFLPASRWDTSPKLISSAILIGAWRHDTAAEGPHGVCPGRDGSGHHSRVDRRGGELWWRRGGLI